MEEFWDERAREDAWYFVDNTGRYRDADQERFWRVGEAELDAVLGAVGAEPRPTDIVLDLGCGIGRLTRALAGRVAHVHALDVSAEMLERARKLNHGLDNVS